MSADRRVALIAVHGIADQQPGQTVREIARLLCHGADGAPRFVQGETHGVLIPVEKLEPGRKRAVDPTPVPLSADKGECPALSRRKPGTPSGFYQAQKSAPAAAMSADDRAPDLGIKLNDYLLGRLTLSEDDALYESTLISLRRRADDLPVDIFELYWADLSRLGTGGVRALTALYQLFFHLGTLSADVVDQIALGTRASRAWRFLQRLHAWSAWLIKGPAALVQLSLLLVVGFGATAFVPTDQQGRLLAAAYGVSSVVLTALAALTWLLGAPSPQRCVRFVLFLSAAVASLVAAIAALQAGGWIPIMYFGAGALATVLVGAFLVDLYGRLSHGVRVPGFLLVAASVIGICVEGRRVWPFVSTQREWMLTSALHVGEFLLAVGLLVWAVLAVVQIVALLLGLGLGRSADRRIRATLDTARLSLVASTALFAVLSLVLWSVIGYVTGLALTDLNYTPAIFGEGYRSAAFFIEDRVQSLGAFFTPLVLLFTLLGAAALLVLAPSLLEELSPSANLDKRRPRRGAKGWSKRLGAWLSGGIRCMNGIFTVIVPFGAIVGGLLYLGFVLRQFAVTAEITGAPARWLADILEYFEGETLVAAGKWLAGGAVTIVALGHRFKETFGRLRVVLDAVLDVDNYFADPRDGQPPRARIYSRFASLLAYLRDAGYARIVIVSHSQGTVISADLLHYLQVQRRLSTVIGEIPIALVTVGSPLRDLYARRFPLLYEWMGSNDAGFTSAAPAAAALGATEWVNACRSGDYVGRFLWTPPGNPARFGIARVDPDGKVQAQRAGDRTEFCLGAGAHTHYFSNDAVALAVEIDRLIGVRGPLTEGKLDFPRNRIQEELGPAA